MIIKRFLLIFTAHVSGVSVRGRNWAESDSSSSFGSSRPPSYSGFSSKIGLFEDGYRDLLTFPGRPSRAYSSDEDSDNEITDETAARECLLETLSDHTIPYSKKLIFEQYKSCLTKDEVAELQFRPDSFPVYYFGQEVSADDRDNIQWKYTQSEIDEFYKVTSQKIQDVIALRPGHHYAFRFKIVKAIGAGSFAMVYKALDMKATPPVHVALKVSYIVGDIDSLPQELSFINFIHHDGKDDAPDDVAQQYDFIIDTAEYMEKPLIQNGAEALIMPLLQTSCEDSYDVKRWSRQLIGALVVLKLKEVIHADIKPENILFRKLDGGQCDIVLNDFGLSAMFEYTKIANFKMGGTKIFEPDERILQKAQRPEGYGLFGFGYEADLFSAGLTILNWLGKTQWHDNFYDTLVKLDHDAGQAKQSILDYIMNNGKYSQSARVRYGIAANFIRLCIRRDMSDRLTLEQAASHWFINEQ